MDNVNKMSEKTFRPMLTYSDEAHRSQYGVFADNIEKLLPTASRIGFTGTPLLSSNEITARTFGGYISVYDFKRAVEDKATVVNPQDIVRVVIAYAFDRARLKYGYKLLRGADFDKKGAVDEDLRIERFDTLKSKLPDVLDVHTWHEFLKAIMNGMFWKIGF